MVRWALIIGVVVLLAIGLPHLTGVTREGAPGTVAADLRTLQAAVESYYIQHQKTYPAPGPAWQAALTAAKPRIVRRALADPYSPAKAPYRFATSSHHVYYVIWSVGLDHLPGITGITDTGTLDGVPGDDLYVSNGASGAGGF